MPESAGLSVFRWRGRDYSLSPSQARVVQRLLQELDADNDHVPEARLLAAAQSDGASRLSDVFNDGKHPAWGTLILPVACAPETCYRLAPLSTPPPEDRSPINDEAPAGAPADGATPENQPPA
jgi:hypothetical protein